MTDEAQAREIGEKYAIAGADMIRRGLPLDACARKLIAAVCVMGQERLVFAPIQAALADVDEKLKALTLEVAEMRDDALEAARVDLGTACATQHEWAVREDSAMRAAVEKNDAEFAEFIRERFKGYTQDLEKRKHATLKIHACQPWCIMIGKDFAHAHCVGKRETKFGSQEVTEYFMDQPPAPSVATAPPVDVPCAKCGIGQRAHRAFWDSKPSDVWMCNEWRAWNLP